jgi:hypothetical protein
MTDEFPNDPAYPIAGLPSRSGLTSMIGDPRKREFAAEQYVAVMTRAAEVNGHAQQAAQPRDPVRALEQAVVALRLHTSRQMRK